MASASPEQQAEEGNTTAAAVALSGRSVGLISNMRERERVIGGGAVVGKVLGRRKWGAKKGRRVYKRGFRGYLRAKPGGAISARTAGQCGRGRTDGYTPGGLLDLSGQRFRMLLEQQCDFLIIRCPDQDPLNAASLG